MSILETRDVSIAFGDRILLSDVSINANAGEVLGLIGPNGAGKSTLLSAISGDLPVRSGSISVNGLDPTTATPLELARARSVMLQDVSVSFSFLVRDVVAMGRRPWARTPRAQKDEALIDAALRATEVDHLAERDIMTLSGGERARVALSRVLAQQTPVVLLDEPTAALDIGHQEQALGLARGMARAGAAVVVVLHDLNAAGAYCDRIACLARGGVAAQGTVEEVYTKEILSDVYGWPIEVLHPHPDQIQVVPERGMGRRISAAASELLDLIHT
ncbi:heme ABC transporter ATP-binding protein [Corynebacterium antarcticum]|uniref:heme ABC transporter ATP-binding protein n=1 Tax=Corynebacterium antarcticum TaxID=2800405 RepID=UPI002003D5FC|nr:heme ABC transporter ATP-binding protein [Corynebacterium antarcticum]MCK7661048.1 heme ABC transporter ATP-binding protein [Corynebacterium antarcticum]MCX7491749.1 heme ABC transporter ATP-binding protein [Corynebacterium antarcticum]